MPALSGVQSQSFNRRWDRLRGELHVAIQQSGGASFLIRLQPVTHVPPIL
jgi:hypothetical protein